MDTSNEQYAILVQKTTQQTAEATSLSQQTTDIEKKKAEAEALANTIREKQKAIEQRTLQNQSTLQIVSRQGGDVSRFNPLAVAEYQKDTQSLQSDINTYNPKVESLSKEIDAYNIRATTFQASQENLSKEIDTYNQDVTLKNEKSKADYDIAVARQKEFNNYLQNVAEGKEAGVQTVDVRLTSRPHPRDPNTLIVEYYDTADNKLPSQSEYTSGETQIQRGTDWQKSIEDWGITGARSYFGLGSEDIIRVNGKIVQESSFTPEQISIASQVSSGRLSALAPYERDLVSQQDRLKSGWTFAQQDTVKLQSLLESTKGLLPTEAEKVLKTGLSGSLGKETLESIRYNAGGVEFSKPDIAEKYVQQSVIPMYKVGDITFSKLDIAEQYQKQISPQTAKPYQTGLEGYGVLPPSAYAEKHGFAMPIPTEIEAQQQKDVYAKNWWEMLPTSQKLIIGAETVGRTIFSRYVDYELSGEDNSKLPQFQTEAYDIFKSGQANYQKYGYVGGFAAGLYSNELIYTGVSALTFGAGLGALSRIAPRLATGIGLGAMSYGVADIGRKAYTGDIRGATIGGLEFAVSAPFAVAGFKAVGGKTVPLNDLIPNLNVNTVKFGQSITPEHMTTTGILVGTGLKLIEPIGIKTSEISLGVSRYLSDVNLKITNAYKDLSYNIRGGSIEKGITPIKNTPYYEYGYKSQLTENLIPEYRTLELPQSAKDFIYNLNRGSISAIGQKPIRNAPYYEYGYETMLGEKYTPSGAIKQKYIFPYSYADIPNILESSIYRMKKDLSYSFNKGQIQTGIVTQTNTPYYEYGYGSMLGEIRPSVKGKSVFEVFNSKVSDVGYKLDYELSRKLSIGFEIKDVLSESSRRMTRDIYDITPKMPKNLHDKFNLALYNKLNRAFGGYDINDVRIKVEGLASEEIFIPYKSIAKGQKGMITAKRDWMVVDTEISMGKVKTNPMKALKQQWKLQEQSSELNRLEKSITDSFKKEPIMPGTTLLKTGKNKGFQSAYDKILEEMQPEPSTSQTFSSKKTSVVRDKTKALKKKWKAEADKIQLSPEVAKELGFTGQKQIVIQKQEVKTKPIVAEAKLKTQYKSATQQIKEANKEIEKITTAKRKQKSGVYPIFFPASSESTEYDYSRTYSQEPEQKTQLVISSLIKSSQTIVIQKEQQKQQSFNIQKPFSTYIPKSDTSQSYKEIQKNIPSELSTLKSLEKMVQKEMSIQTPKLRTSQREDIAQVPKFAFPVLSKSDIPQSKQHKSHRKSSAYTIKNQFAGLDDLLGTPEKSSKKQDWRKTYGV